jgi:hypothetical protein
LEEALPLREFQRHPQITSPKSEALRPVLWLAALCAGVITSGLWSTAAFAIWLCAFGGLCFAATMSYFFYAHRHLMLHDPDRLQSENYMVSIAGDNRWRDGSTDEPVRNSGERK